MKQMSLIEMDGFLKGKCFPRDLKVNETNAEYLVRKFGELESKIALLEVQLKLSEAAERAWESSMMQACGEDGPKSVADKFAELEAKCAALATDNEKAMEAMRQADAAVKLAHEKFSALAAVCYINETGTVNRNGGKPWGWPWDASWWKPNARRRNLVKAGALILAEIERIDRAAGIGKGE